MAKTILDDEPTQVRVRSSQNKDSKKPSKFGLKKMLLIAGVLVVVGVGALAMSRGSGPTSNAEVVDRVKTLVEGLPEEQPTVATVENAEALTAQDGFYAGSENGDKLLVYVNSNRAIIYRPSSNAVIKDGSVSVSE